MARARCAGASNRKVRPHERAAESGRSAAVVKDAPPWAHSAIHPLNKRGRSAGPLPESSPAGASSTGFSASALPLWGAKPPARKMPEAGYPMLLPPLLSRNSARFHRMSCAIGGSILPKSWAGVFAGSLKLAARGEEGKRQASPRARPSRHCSGATSGLEPNRQLQRAEYAAARHEKHRQS